MLIPISNSPRDYAWGSTTLIASLEGREPSGAPEAEIWYGAHAGSPSRVDDGTGRTLDTALEDAGVAPLPYLLKLLAAGTSLSIQAHPSREEAAAGYAREDAAGIPRDAAERTYRDENHKPEIIVALSEVFRALVGLRPLARTRRLLASLETRPGVEELSRRLRGEDEPEVLRDALAWALSDAGRAAVPDVTAALGDARSDEFSAELDVLRDVCAAFPGDPGILVAVLMNLVVLRRGEALFAPAGVLHAYQDGLGVELMAASDNVLRGGLTPKHIDVAELLRIVDTRPDAAPVVAPVETAPGVFVYDAGVADFILTRVEVAPGRSAEVAVAGTAIVLAARGRIEVSAAAESVTVRPGAALVTDGDVVILGEGEAFVAQPGRA